MKENTPYVFKPAADVMFTNEDFTTDVEAGTAVAEPVKLVGTYSGKRLAATEDTACMVISADKTFQVVGEAGDAMFATKAALYVPADKAKILESYSVSASSTVSAESLQMMRPVQERYTPSTADSLRPAAT